MEKGYSKDQLQEKLDAWKKIPWNYLSGFGRINKHNSIQRIEKKLKNFK